MKALIGIGTNIGDRDANIQTALESISLVPTTTVLRSSSVYETEPWGFAEQDDFFNIVCEIETQFTPEALLGVCLGIEAAMGRVRCFKNGPRVIDIDVLLCEGVERNTSELKLPHPFIGERDFVLVPMAELFEDLSPYGFNYKRQYEQILVNSSAKKVQKSKK